MRTICDESCVLCISFTNKHVIQVFILQQRKTLNLTRSHNIKRVSLTNQQVKLAMYIFYNKRNIQLKVTYLFLSYYTFIWRDNHHN